jgi:hypothetical protein
MRGYKRHSTGLFIPERLAKKIGIGCPKCDDHFLQDPKLGEASHQGREFIGKHQACGPLDALELVDGKIVCTGPVEIRVQRA